MAETAVTIPLWGKLVLLSIAKKGVILGAGYLYGFPRLYRRSQKLVRYLVREKSQRQEYEAYVRSGFRLPMKLLHWNQQPKTSMPPALSYLHQLPTRLLPSHQRLKPAWQEPRLDYKQSRLAAFRTSFAASPLIARHSERWAVRREKLTLLREKYTGTNYLQTSMRQHAAKMVGNLPTKPFAFVPGIRIAS